MSDTLRGALYGLTAAAIWGGLYVVSDQVLTIIPPFTLLTIRLVLGLMVLGMTLPFRRGKMRWPKLGEGLQLLGVGLVGFGLSVGAQFVGTDLSNAVNGALVTSASPAFILIFAALILGEKLTLQRITAVTLATVGVIVIIDLNRVDLTSDTFIGNLVLASAAVTWGLYSVLVKKVTTDKLDTIIVTFFVFIGGLLLTFPAALIELPQRPVGQIDLNVLLGVLYLGIVSTAVAMWLWNRAFALVEASMASLFFFAQPLVGAALGVLIGQPLTSALIVGSLLITLGVLLSVQTVRYGQATLNQ